MLSYSYISHLYKLRLGFSSLALSFKLDLVLLSHFLWAIFLCFCQHSYLLRGCRELDRDLSNTSRFRQTPTFILK